MESAQEIFNRYTLKISEAATETEKLKAKKEWNEAYEALPESYKLEIRAILKQQVKDLFKSQGELDARITAAGFPSFEDFLAQNAVPVH